MGGLRVQVRDDIERRFREAAMRRFGYMKGALSKAAEEALLRWLSSIREAAPFEGDPVEAIDGLLADIDIGAVELQHAARELWAKRVLEHVPRRH
ncbi:MAG: hypothetical protein ACE5OY_07995 [Candidatus Bathyarchaeia archaeon]